MKFKVVGGRPVAGVTAGGVVELDLPEANIRALIRGGHIVPLPKPSTKKEAG